MYACRAVPWTAARAELVPALPPLLSSLCVLLPPGAPVLQVASTNLQDFYNLVDVYLDAVFHPKCVEDPRIFAQEGWHFELDDKEVRGGARGGVGPGRRGRLGRQEVGRHRVCLMCMESARMLQLHQCSSCAKPFACALGLVPCMPIRWRVGTRHDAMQSLLFMLLGCVACASPVPSLMVKTAVKQLLVANDLMLLHTAWPRARHRAL